MSHCLSSSTVEIISNGSHLILNLTAAPLSTSLERTTPALMTSHGDAPTTSGPMLPASSTTHINQFSPHGFGGSLALRRPPLLAGSHIRNQLPMNMGQSSEYGYIDPQMPMDGWDQDLDPTFGDKLAELLHFGEGDDDLRQALATFIQLGGGLLKPDIMTRAYNFGINLQTIKLVNSFMSNFHHMQAQINDMAMRMEDNFKLSTDQLTSVRLIAQDALYQPELVMFKMVQVKVKRIIQENPEALRLHNVFGNPAREKILVNHIQVYCRSARNHFREHLRNSVFGDNTLSLDDCVFHMANRFKRGGHPEMQPEKFALEKAKFALLRRFTYENPSLLNLEEVDDDPSEDNGGSSSREETPEQSAPSPAPSTQHKRKRSENLSSNKRACRHDFWKYVDTWFADGMKKWGASMGDPGWQEYIRESIERDESQFKADLPLLTTIALPTSLSSSTPPPSTTNAPVRLSNMDSLLSFI